MVIAAPAAGDEPVEGGAFAAKRSKVYHSLVCAAAKKISEGNIVRFKSARDAEESGRRLCRMCAQLADRGGGAPVEPGAQAARKDPPTRRGEAESRPTEPGSQAAASVPGTVLIKKVLAGGTLLTEKDEKLRLLGIRCPEEGQPLAREVVRFIREQTRNRRVRLAFDSSAGPSPQRDDLGRLMVYVFAQPGERDLGEELLYQGFGWIDHAVDCDRRAAYLVQEHEAWWDQRGVWDPCEGAAGLREVVIGMRAHEYHLPGCGHVAHLTRPMSVNVNDAKSRRLAPCDAFREPSGTAESRRKPATPAGG
jgi:endonuclease YncB( thermonuclease family)